MGVWYGDRLMNVQRDPDMLECVHFLLTSLLVSLRTELLVVWLFRTMQRICEVELLSSRCSQQMSGCETVKLSIWCWSMNTLVITLCETQEKQRYWKIYDSLDCYGDFEQPSCSQRLNTCHGVLFAGVALTFEKLCIANAQHGKNCVSSPAAKTTISTDLTKIVPVRILLACKLRTGLSDYVISSTLAPASLHRDGMGWGGEGAGEI